MFCICKGLALSSLKGLIKLEVYAKEEWEETAHAKSFKVMKFQKYAEYQPQKDGCCSLFEKFCLEKSKVSEQC